jgi:hypothetical protein
MDLTTIITVYFVPIAAVIGLILSIYNTYRQWKEFRRNITLEFYYIEKDFEPSIGEIPLNCYILLVKNLGNVNIIIDIAGLKWENMKYERHYYGSSFFENYHNFPYKLEPGSTLSIEFPRREVQNEISKCSLSDYIELQGFIKDGDGKYYSSLSLEIPSENEYK